MAVPTTQSSSVRTPVAFDTPARDAHTHPGAGATGARAEAAEGTRGGWRTGEQGGISRRDSRGLCGGARCAERRWWRRARRRIVNLPRRDADTLFGAGGNGRAAPVVGVAGSGLLRGGWRAGCGLQHTTRGHVKSRRWVAGAAGIPLGCRGGLAWATHFA